MVKYHNGTFNSTKGQVVGVRLWADSYRLVSFERCKGRAASNNGYACNCWR
jgi:hypothetical protein